MRDMERLDIPRAPGILFNPIHRGNLRSFRRRWRRQSSPWRPLRAQAGQLIQHKGPPGILIMSLRD